MHAYRLYLSIKSLSGICSQHFEVLKKYVKQQTRVKLKKLIGFAINLELCL